MKSQLGIKIVFAILAAILFLPGLMNAQAPKMEYSTFLGGGGYDYGHSITVDDNGCAYIAGQVSSTNFPTTTGAYDRTANGSADIFVTKLNKEGSALIYSTYIGGSAFDDTRNVCIDKSGCVYLTGSTSSTNFPTTNGSLQGSSSGYFLKLDSLGSNLIYSSRWNGGEKVLVDSKGYLIIMGNTNSATFPTTSNAYSRTLSGGNDIFVAKIDIKTNQILFSTLIGGAGDEWAPNIVLDSQDNIIIAGQTSSENFPTKGNTFGSYTAGKYNIFVTKLKSDGSQLLFSTIVGGTNDNWPWDVAIDLSENIYVTGGTSSTDFPVSASAFGKTYKGLHDAFLFKLKSDGSQLVYSSYFGGTDQDEARGVAIDKNGRAYITGCTRSTNFPITTDAYDNSYNGGGTNQYAWGDPFLSVMNADGSQLEYSTYLGGSNDEEAYGIAIDKQGSVYLSGVSTSSNYPTTAGAYDRSINGPCNVYVTKFSFNFQTDIKTENSVPQQFRLNQNYPNPFNPSTVISYRLAVAVNVNLAVYNLLGQKIKTLVNSFQNAGEHSISWNATNNANSAVSSGIYFYYLETGAMNLQKKMVLVR